MLFEMDFLADGQRPVKKNHQPKLYLSLTLIFPDDGFKFTE